MIPKPCLSEYIQQVSKGTIKRSNIPFEYTIRFDGETRQKSDQILKSLKLFLHKYYVERKDKQILIYFWDKEEGIKAQQYLENTNQIINFYGEENVVMIEDEEIENDEIIESEVLEDAKVEKGE